MDKLGQAYYMESFVPHIFGHKGDRVGGSFGQKIEFIPPNVCLNGTARLPVVGHKLLESDRVKDSATQRMRAYVSSLFNKSHLKVKSSPLGKLHEMNGTSKGCWPAPHKKDIKFDLFSSPGHYLFTC